MVISSRPGVSAVKRSLVYHGVISLELKSSILKKFIFLVLALITHHAFSQSNYWQQELNYAIDVSLQDKTHMLSGKMSVDYINHSPDTLHFIWFHLWPNGYKDSSTAYARQLRKLKDRGEKTSGITENGYIDSLLFTAEGQPLKLEADPDNIDLVKVLLPSPLLPGKRLMISTPFRVKIPSYVSRLGFSGDMFMLTQWYPKPAVYDRKGWHPIPYLDQGEFYSDYGKYKVNITLPSSYVVAATGTLMNEEESSKYKSLGKKNIEQQNRNSNRVKWEFYKAASNTSKTLSYQGENIHDFAWFADKDFIVNYDTLQLPSGKTIDVFSFYQPDGNKEWRNSLGFIENAVSSYSQWVGEYPYPVVNAVEGPANGSSGGMEYPMITLITSPDANKERLDAVITHEVGHNWFYGILGSNERDHAWMDEGINSYYQFRYEAEKYKANSIFGDQIPRELKRRPTDEFLGIIYNAIGQMDIKFPVETSSETFSTSDDYGMTVYVKAALWMYIMELSVGKEALEKAMHTYFNEWKFRHPYPEDLKTALEQSTGKGLQGVFLLLEKQGSFK